MGTQLRWGGFGFYAEPIGGIQDLGPQLECARGVRRGMTYEELLHEVFRRIVEAFGERVVECLNFAEALVVVDGREARGACDDEVQRAPYGPYVGATGRLVRSFKMRWTCGCTCLLLVVLDDLLSNSGDTYAALPTKVLDRGASGLVKLILRGGHKDAHKGRHPARYMPSQSR